MPVLCLPADHPRPTGGYKQQARHEAAFQISEACWKALGSDCKLAPALLAAFQLLLGRYSRQGEFAVALHAGTLRQLLVPGRGSTKSKESTTSEDWTPLIADLSGVCAESAC